MFCDLSKIKQREINKNKSSNKLSSGKKVIGAAYDAAGFSISETMKAKIRGLHQAERNATNVISMLQVTDGGLDIIYDMLQRMRELSIQSLSDTLTREDRKNIQDEFRELKFQIDQVCKQTNFNTKNLYEEHMPMYHEFSGNRRLGDTVSVISGYNDNLGIKVDGKLVEIVLDEGIYTFEELADMIDDKLFEIDGNIIVSVKENRTLSISAENYKDIEGLTGGAASFFYEYHLGSGGGIVYGSSDLSGRLKIVKDSNDVFSFNVDGKTYTIKFNPSRQNDINTWYTAEDLVNTMNEQLKQQNANVKVYMHGKKYCYRCRT